MGGEPSLSNWLTGAVGCSPNCGRKRCGMFESTISLLNGLFITALILLMFGCIVGSIVVALRAVSGVSASFIDEHRALSGDRALEGVGTAEIAISRGKH